MIIIGLTGSSGSGKTVFGALLRDCGAKVIDSDLIAREVLFPEKPAYKEVLDYFGKEILEDGGAVNRKLLGNIVFNDRKKLEKLTQITHKYIIEDILSEIEGIRKAQLEYKCIVVDAPLLLESGLDKICDQVWVVYADYGIRLNRIINRDGITMEMAQKRLNNQMPYEILKKHADCVIMNNCNDMDGLRGKAQRLMDGI